MKFLSTYPRFIHSFFIFLSLLYHRSILIPLALSLFSSGGMMGLGGGLGGGLLGGGLGGGLPVPGVIGGVLGRRRRSLDITNPADKLLEYGKQLGEALKQYQTKLNTHLTSEKRQENVEEQSKA